MIFNTKVFERLLFPIHKDIYKIIEERLQEVEKLHPGKIDEIKSGFSKSFTEHTNFQVWYPGHKADFKYPSINIAIGYIPEKKYKLANLVKYPNPMINFDYDETVASQYPGNHLVIGYSKHNQRHTYIVQMGYLLGVGAERVLKPESYQLYAHSLVSQEVRQKSDHEIEMLVASTPENVPKRVDGKMFQESMLQYIGITKRTWQKRFREHLWAAGRGSELMFHKALRGEFIDVGVYEHVIERAGLTEKEALALEEKEVEDRTLYPIHLRGLNMIPGGRAGLRFMRNWAKSTGYEPKDPVTPDNIENVLADLQSHNLRNNREVNRGKKTNAQLARLWAENLEFRISVMTNREDRLTLDQIIYSRIWHASGWPLEKIHSVAKGLSDRPISITQIQNLLDGMTYTSIPAVIL